MILSPILDFYLRPVVFSWIKQTRGIRPTIKIGKEKFQLQLDVRQFNKEELRVKARAEYVIIEGKQERQTKNGCVVTVRHFFRKYKLPHGCNPSKINTNLSADGMLTVVAPRSFCDFNLPCETVVPIRFKDSKESKDDATVRVQPAQQKPEDK